MNIVNKHSILVIFSSFIIVVVLVATLLGYNIYVQWVEDTSSVKYRDDIYKLTAHIFKKNIDIYNIIPKSGNEAVLSGVLDGMPILEGKIKNNTSKIITSVMVEIYFSDPDGSVVYRDWFYPLGENYFFDSPFFSGKIRPQMVLPPGETMTFRYLLRNCPAHVLSQILSSKNFAKINPDKEVKMILNISGVTVL